MTVIWKYYVYSDKPDIVMPGYSQILSVGEENSNVVMWALVDPQRPAVTRRFRLVMTGEKLDVLHVGHYVGTVQIRSKGLTAHVFEVS